MDLARYVLCGRKLASFDDLVYGQVCILWVIVERQRSVDLARYVLCGRELASCGGSCMWPGMHSLSDRGESEFECFYGLSHPRSGFLRVAGEGMLEKGGGEGRGQENRRKFVFFSRGTKNSNAPHLRKHKATLVGFEPEASSGNPCPLPLSTLGKR